MSEGQRAFVWAVILAIGGLAATFAVYNRDTGTAFAVWVGIAALCYGAALLALIFLIVPLGLRWVRRGSGHPVSLKGLSRGGSRAEGKLRGGPSPTTIELTTGFPRPSIKTEDDWISGASARRWFWDLFPHLRGVLLWTRPRDGSPLEPGTYHCTVTGPEPEARAKVPRTEASPDALYLTYPKDFEGVPKLPLGDGEYAVEWSLEEGIGKRLVARMAFTVVGGEVERGKP